MTTECEKLDALNGNLIVFSVCQNTESKWFNQQVPPNCRRCFKPEPKAKKSAKPKMPSLPRQAANAAKAVLQVLVDPRMVSNEQYQARLAECEECDFRVNNRCLLCGCFWATKTRFKTFKCPDNPPRWPIL